MRYNNAIVQYVNGHLRKIFKWTQDYRLIKHTCKLLNGLYRCRACKCYIDKNGEIGITRIYENQTDNSVKMCNVYAERMFVDHIEPVIPLEGFKNQEQWAANIVSRTLTPMGNLQYICDTCHYIKTHMYENPIRKLHKLGRDIK